MPLTTYIFEVPASFFVIFEAVDLFYYYLTAVLREMSHQQAPGRVKLSTKKQSGCDLGASRTSSSRTGLGFFALTYTTD